jgi:hypothetical protein
MDETTKVWEQMTNCSCTPSIQHMINNNKRRRRRRRKEE